jgi:hypothetical protein
MIFHKEDTRPLFPLASLFHPTTTSTTAYREITGKFWRIVQGDPAEVAPDSVRCQLNIGLSVRVVSCVLVILVSAVFRWLAPVKGQELPSSEVSSEIGERSQRRAMNFSPVAVVGSDMITHQPYPSDVSDAEWAFVEPYVCLMREDAAQRPAGIDRMKTGCWTAPACRPSLRN